MANPALETFTDRGMVLKAEATEGVDAAPTAILNAFQILDGKSKLDADPIDRKIDRPYFNSAKKKYSNFRGSIDGTIELVPPAAPGTDKASVGLALQICGMAETLDVGPPGVTTYNPISRLIPSATAWFWHSGTLRKITGARGNITGLAMEIGKYLMAQIHIEGSSVPMTEASLPTDFDFTSFLDPTDASTESMELLIGGFAVNGKSLSIDFGNALKTIQHTEARIARIASKASTFKALFYRTALADFDPEAKWRAGDIIELKSKITEPDTRFTRLTALGQVTAVEETEIDGDFGWTVSGSLVADTGNDELLIEFSEA
jgi:hypothetical protein